MTLSSNIVITNFKISDYHTTVSSSYNVILSFMKWNSFNGVMIGDGRNVTIINSEMLDCAIFSIIGSATGLVIRNNEIGMFLFLLFLFFIICVLLLTRIQIVQFI